MSNTIETVNPATGATLRSYEAMTPQAVDATIQRCQKAHLAWRDRPLEERATVVAAIADALEAREDDLVACMTREMGKLTSQGHDEVELCAAICRWTAEHGVDELRDEERSLPDGGRGIVTHRPIGIVYGIQPWNYPAYQVIRYSIANLLAGNGVLLKHASSVTGSALLLEEIYRDAGVPEDLFAVLVIDHDQSDEVIQHELVRGVTLTGSSDAGRHVAEIAGRELKKTVLELGSNDAYIVLDDADLEKAVEACVTGRIYNNGETCIAAKRFVVVDAVYDAFRDRFVKAMEALTLGDPTDEATDLGPMARKDLREQLHEQVQESVSKGAKVLCGGEMPDGDGFFYPATVLDDVKPGQPAYDQELFGPVASLIRAEDEDDAMRIANDSRFGLGGGILSGDEERAVRLARDRFDTGMVFVNGFGLATPAMPFGGVKDSGYGREHGGFGVREFVNSKSIVIS